MKKESLKEDIIIKWKPNKRGSLVFCQITWQEFPPSIYTNFNTLYDSCYE